MIVNLNILDDVGPAHEAGPWADVSARIIRPTSQILRVAILNRGTAAGRPSVMVLLVLPDGTYAVGEITGDMWEAVAGAIRGARARWGVEDRP